MSLIKDNLKETPKYKKCKACNGHGKREMPVSYYDYAMERCTWCNGQGQIVVATLVESFCNQPFPLAKD